MEYIQFTGKTRLDAISKAMEKFSVSEDRLDIQVLDEGSKGFLGCLLYTSDAADE